MKKLKKRNVGLYLASKIKFLWAHTKCGNNFYVSKTSVHFVYHGEIQAFGYRNGPA